MERKTAVITGASSGIGMEFARAFAKMGYHLVLVARRRDRLEKLDKELSVLCHIIVADLSQESECYQFCEKIERMKIDVFVNNAGFGICGSFCETDLKKEISMIDVNIRAMHILFKKVLKKMEKQGYGRILNVASSAGLIPAGPYMAAYYATKSYVVSLTKAVAEELKEKNSKIYVGALCPGPVDTEFNERADVVFSLRGISAKYCVKEALLGMKKRKTVIVPSSKMKLCVAGQKLLPEHLLLKIVAMQQKKKIGQ
jgi:hypothetical protein